MKTEITVMKNIKHPNIVRLFAYNMKAKYPERDENAIERDVILLVMEYMSGGELFDILYYTNALPEILARTYFHQLMSGVEALHNRHINHRDLKPQNLLLDKKYMLKISDFGLSKIMQPSDDGMMRSYRVGTRGYQAPEIILNKPYTSSCDIFACGVILFLLLTGYPPFQTASIEDRWYGNIARGKVKKFWKQHRGCGLKPYAIDLVTRMLAFDPNQRITLNDIKKHPWFTNEDVIKNNKDLKKLLQLRHTQMEIKRANDPVKQQILVASEKFRGLNDDSKESKINEEEKFFVPKSLSDEDGIGIFDVFTTYSAYQVLTYIQEFSQSQFSFRPVIDKKECSLIIRTAFQSTLSTISADESKCEALITVYKYDEYKCNLVKFIKINGNHILWRKTFEQLMIWLRPVLNGVPKDIEKEKLSIIDEQDKQMLKKCFDPAPKPIAKPAKTTKTKKQSKRQKAKDVSAVLGDDFDYDFEYDDVNGGDVNDDVAVGAQ